MPGCAGERAQARQTSGDVARQAPGRDGDEIEAHGAAGELAAAAAGRPRRRGRSAPAAAAAGRPAHRSGAHAPLDLDEDQKIAAPGDEVDLAHRGGVAAGQDAIAAQPQQPGGQRSRRGGPRARGRWRLTRRLRRQGQRAAVELVGGPAGGGGDRGGRDAAACPTAAPRAAAASTAASSSSPASRRGRRRSPPRPRPWAAALAA